jgi:hypothetical protein
LKAWITPSFLILDDKEHCALTLWQLAGVPEPVKPKIGAASRIVGAEPPHAITYVAASMK